MARTRDADADAAAVQPLPRGIRACLDKQPRPRHGDNFGLWLDKYLPLHHSQYELTGPQRERVLREHFIGGPVGRPVLWRSPAACEALERQHETCGLLYGPGNYRSVEAKLHGRLLMDYARLSTIESNLSFHHALGVPRIPGSALKGLVRSALRPRLDKETLAELLGAPDLEVRGKAQELHSRGRLVLHDALPVNGEFKLDLDILNPHFRDYYEGRSPPADWLSPVPHTFLTVVDTSFRIVFGLLPVGRDGDAKLLGLVDETLREALWEGGLGAKRSAGYGRFRASSTKTS